MKRPNPVGRDDGEVPAEGQGVLGLAQVTGSILIVLAVLTADELAVLIAGLQATPGMRPEQDR